MKKRKISFMELQVGDIIEKCYDVTKEGFIGMVVQLPPVLRDEKTLFRIFVLKSSNNREIGRVFDSIGNGSEKDMFLVSRVDEK
jgi:hypothetical protein